MPKLTPEELQFIDNYLKAAGIEYADIRFEMTDHVASALEEMHGNFIENLKYYMLQHKAELLKNNRTFTRRAFTRAWKTLGKTLIKPAFLLLFAVFTLAYLILKNTMGIEATTSVMRTVYSVVVIAAAAHNVYDRHILKVKFSVSDKLITTVCLAMYWFVYLMHMETHIENPTMLMVYHALITTLLCVVYYSYISLVKRYKMQFVK